MMAFVKLEDLYGVVECIVFPSTYERYNKFIQEDGLVVIEGRISISEVDEPKIIAEKVSSLNTFKKGKVYLKIASNSPSNTFDKLKYILRKYNGETPVYVYMEKEKRTVVADRSLWIDIESEEVISALKKVLGEESVKIS